MIVLDQIVSFVCIFTSAHSSRSLGNREEAPSEVVPELQHESEAGPLLGGAGHGQGGDDAVPARQLGKHTARARPNARTLTHSNTYMECLPFFLSLLQNEKNGEMTTNVFMNLV